MRRFVAAGFGVGLLPRRLRGTDAGAGTLGALLAGGLALGLANLPVYVHLGNRGRRRAAVALGTSTVPARGP